MKIPSPSEIGLPEKFASWRPNQEPGLNVMITSTKRVTAVSAPTGWGKSPVYVGAALMSGKRTCIVTANRGLQTQLMDDFAPCGLVDLRGRANYACSMRDDYTCEDGFAARCVYKGTMGCAASKAEMLAATSPLVVTNYAKWCAAKKFGTGMENFEQVIFDEGHEAPDALAQAMQVVLNHREMEEELGMSFLKFPEANDFANWKPWASEARAVAEAALEQASSKIQGIRDPKTSWIRQVTHCRNMVRRLATLASASAKDWVVDEVKEGFQFDPIRPARYAEMALLLRVPRIIIVSATLRPKTMFMLGIPQKAFDFSEYDSDFPPARCPIYWIPTMRVDKRADDLSMLWLRLDQIAAKRRDVKGIVHSVSYNRRNELVSRSRFGRDMLINEQGEPNSQMVESFKASGPGTMLVSPSVGTGYDFPGDECRWQFMVKVPFEPPSKIQKAREAEDNEYSAYRAMQKLVQAAGRGMRSKTDWCEFFIADDHIEWFRGRYGHLAPRSFHNFFKKVGVVPPPLRLS